MLKRVIKVVAGLALAGLLVLGGLVGMAFATARPIDRTSFADGRVILADDGYVTCAVVDVGGGEVALIDACMDPDAKAILAALEARGAGPDDVVAILLTHGHVDHLGGVARFPGAEVMALGPEAPLVAGEIAAGSPVGRLMGAKDVGARVTRVVHDGEVLQVGEARVEVFAVPGHTPGSAAWLVHGVLHLGDSAGADREGRLGGAPWVFSEDTARNRQALVDLAGRLAGREADVRTLAFSHAGAVDGLQPLLEYRP